MRSVSKLAVAAAIMFVSGCGATAIAPTATSTAPVLATTLDEIEDEVTEGEVTVDVDALAAFDLESLPPSPWSATPLASEQVPAAVLTAWANADNRGHCAPLAPVALGAADGAEPRVSPELVEGGWAVEFDRRGLPGVAPSGRACQHCGRGVFGIAGTQMTPDQLVTEDDVADIPTPTFADGSHVAVEPPAEGESVAAASLTVRGQGCVYQVWSFLGEEHVRELVDELRLVEVRETSVVAAR